jgi:hypothetical protein
MDLERIFSVAGAIAMSGWLLLVFFPRNSIARLISGIVMPIALSIFYLILIASNIRGAEGGFGSLADVATLFQKQELLLAGWIHYLAFDLFIGAWEVRDAQRNQIPHLLVIPSLLMTFMLGPIGLLFYLAIRTAKTRSLSLSRRSLGEGGENE